VAFTGLNAMFFLRRESVVPPTSSGSSTVSIVSPNVPPKVPPNVPLISEDTSDLSKNVSFPGGAPAQVDKWSTKTSKTRDPLPLGNAASRDTAQQEVGYCCVVVQHGQKWDPVSLPRVDQEWHTYAVPSGGAQPDPAGED
jgi:hypothetical protein